MTKRFLFFCLLILPILVGIAAVPFSYVAPKATVVPRSQTPSAAIFGTNLGLYNGGDPFFSSAFRSEMGTIGVHAIRMPIRTQGGTPSAVEIQAMQDIKAMGAVPVVIMHGATDGSALSDDIAIVKAVASVFGSSPVYIEMGNEEDLAGVGVAQYTATWNSIIPQVQPLDPAARFGGPVNFQYDSAYIHTFIQTANPAPAFISWHEYTCPNEASGYCISHIANWANHMADYHTYSQVPVLITEYNYSPNENTGDAAFLQQWMTAAMEEWVNLGVAGAFQYAVNPGGTSGLIDPGSNGALPEGQTFQAEYQKYFGNGGPPSPTPTPPAPTPMPSPSPTPPPPPPHASGLQMQFQVAWNQGTLPSSGPLYMACLNAALTRHIIVGTPIRSFPSTDWGDVALTYTEFSSGLHTEMHADGVVRIYSVNIQGRGVQVYP